MIIIGLTGGIASGKTTIVNFLKKKKYAIHDSDGVVKKIYSKPTYKFIKYLKKIGFPNSIKNQKINKNTIREEIFINKRKKRELEKFIHKEVKKSREKFLKKHKKSIMVFLDIPLLFENNLEKICDYVILLSAPKVIRKKRAIKRTGMRKKIVENIMNNQLSDSLKRKKADFIIKTNTTKKNTYTILMKTINSIKKKYA